MSPKSSLLLAKFKQKEISQCIQNLAICAHDTIQCIDFEYQLVTNANTSNSESGIVLGMQLADDPEIEFQMIFLRSMVSTD